MELIRQAKRLLISSTVLGELLEGFACGDRQARNREELRRFLRQQGTPIPSNDLWIAASCLEHGALLFSLDAHAATSASGPSSPLQDGRSRH